MVRLEAEMRARAAALADELAAGLREGRAVEWVEQVVGSALLAAIREERERCAALADRRVDLWDASTTRMSSPGWPSGATAEARARRNEAQVIADAIRAGAESA
ncbi:MAG TPA: hypothetical protein VG106_05625 [Vicinamibacterales bacterium]|nr:hypothetical protein [Vicinamibacterales bacterium]